jgi:hypothetical protein
MINSCDNVKRKHYARKPLLQRTIYSGFQLKTAVNGFTAVVKSKSLLRLQRLLAKNRCNNRYKRSSGLLLTTAVNLFTAVFN